VERVFADRTRTENDEEISEYLVKWKGLSYAESTWYFTLCACSRPRTPCTFGFVIKMLE